MIQNLIRSHHDKFHKIVVCGAKNELLNYPETKDKSFFHRPKTEDDLIYDPFSEIEELNQGNCEGKQILCIYDDLLEYVFKSHIVSKLFSRGRHENLSCVVILQSYFPKYKGVNLSTQIKNNSTIQIFTRSSSMSEVYAIASRLEFDKKHKTLFLSLYKKTCPDKKIWLPCCFIKCLGRSNKILFKPFEWGFHRIHLCLLPSITLKKIRMTYFQIYIPTPI